MDKSGVRKHILKQRLALNSSSVKAMSLSCFERLIDFFEKDSFHSIGIYISAKNEVETQRMIDYLWSLKKDVYVPLCLNEGIMDFYKIASWDDVQKGKYDILEPKKHCPKQQGLDVLIVPMVAFNMEGYRLGVGGGYYDRYIEKNPTYTIGLAYQFQKQPFKPSNYDLKFDVVVTEQEVIFFENSIK